MINARRKTLARELGKGHAEVPLGAVDWWMVAIVLTLLCLGRLMVLSASGGVGYRLAGV